MSYLGFEEKSYMVFGVANKKSVAYHIAKIIAEEGGRPIFSVQDEEKKEAVLKLFPGADVFLCDVADVESVEGLSKAVAEKFGTVHGIVHSVAFANFSDGLKPFHEVKKKDFLEALDISCFSLVTISNAFRDVIDKKGSVVTISISTTRMAAENYGYMAPIKAALDSTLVFLAKSFSAFSEVRFNAVAPGLLKTSASAGIPGYVDSFLFAEKATLRKRAVSTPEAAKTATFLLSDAASGVNAQKIVVDAGMSTNFFDQEIIRSSLKT